MPKRLREKALDEAGITLTELLVVCMILGMLAGITVPGFINQNQRSSDTQAKVEARAAASAMETYANENLGAYDGANGTVLNAMDSAIPKDIGVETFGPNAFGIAWIVTRQNPKTNHTFRLIKIVNGRLLSNCDVNPGLSDNQTGAGGCPTDGNWNGNY